jgi:tetratricopeptide (TPR) repeat protein
MRKSFLVLGIIILFISKGINAQQMDNPSPEKMDAKAATYYNNAIQLMKAEKFEDALKSIDSSLLIAKDYRTYFLQGQAFLKLGQVNDAKQSFSESVKLNPNYDMAWMSLGNAHLAVKEYQLAENDFKKVAEVTKDSEVKKKAEESLVFVSQSKAADLFNQGKELYKQNKFEEAINLYDQALTISKDPKFYYQKGLALSKLSKNKEAVDALKSAVALDNSFDAGYVALASLQTANKDFAGAIDSYQKALSVTKDENLKANISDNIPKTYLMAGNNAYKEKKYDSSIEWILKSIAASPTDAAYLGLAKAYIEKKKFNEAANALDSAKSLQKTVSDGAIAYYTGLIQRNKGEDKKALDSFTIALNDPTYKKASQAEIDYLKAKQKGTQPKK